MAKLVMCQGLPASGKSTWARDQQGFTVVEKDDIRRNLEKQGWTWSQKAEQDDVIPARDIQITAVLAAGGSVISADTNFGPVHEQRLRALARMHGAEFEIHQMGTSVDECIRRDSLRKGKEQVGRQVIIGMAKKYLGYVEPKLLQDDNLMPALICDLDGTLSLFKEKGHRDPYDASRCDEDDLCRPIARLIEVYYRIMQYQIIYLSGRFEQYRPQTNTFMLKHHCPPGPLWMRPDGDTRNDAIVKQEIFDREIRGKYRVEFVLDDRDRVVQMWRGLGLTCLQVAEGNF